MSYATEDFAESLHRVRIDPTNIETVIAAWGYGSGMGYELGTSPGWSEEGVTDWAGGFLFRLVDGRYAYLTGWCDYTGWGCQDGATVTYFDAEPALVDLGRPPDCYNTEPLTADAWDQSPADLNRWLKAGAAR